MLLLLSLPTLNVSWSHSSKVISPAGALLPPRGMVGKKSLFLQVQQQQSNMDGHAYVPRSAAGGCAGLTHGGVRRAWLTIQGLTCH